MIVDIPGEAPYDVRIGSGVLARLGSHLRAMSAFENVERVLVVTDEEVARLYRADAKDSLAQAGFRVSDIAVPPGERSKSLDVIGEIWEAMAGIGLGRDCAVAALGGGVVGDLAGFAAAAYMRGVPVVQVPTTLLSMVDSSVGGKTGVNLAAGKQPAYVCADTATLATLPDREWTCGCAEIAKSAVIDSDEFFFWLAEAAERLAARDEDVTAEAIARSVVFKADVVAADKAESNGALVGASLDFVRAQDDLLDALGLPVLDWLAEPADMLDAMKRDKKARGGRIRFVLPRDVGSWEVSDVDDEILLEHLDAWRRSKE